MRTNKEILKLLLENIDQLRTGLCGLANRVDITYNEYYSIYNYISRYRPNKKSKLYGHGPDITNNQYYWEKGDKESRARWLKYHIKICKS